MKVLAVPSDEEFDSLPPALRRKYFLNHAEHVRLQLAQAHPNRRTRSRHRSGRLHFDSPRSRLVANVLSKESGLEKSPYNSRKLCKPRSLQLAYLAAQADSKCFHSLPAKIQQKHFSEEERLFLRQAYQRFALDAADRSKVRSAGDPQAYPALRNKSSHSTVPFSQASTLYLGASDKGEAMDDSLYNSFRWLDEDADLDLSLNGYHTHNGNSMPTRQTRRRRSFRRTMSFNSAQLTRKSSLAMRHKRFPSLTRMFHAPLPSTTTSRASTIEPLGNDVPRSSGSSTEPVAQYYQDPDARLKLRTFLSSPQKFDEAIQFGFPALETKENRNLEQPPSETEAEPEEFTGTFLDDDDDKSVFSDRDEPDELSDCRSSTDNKDGLVKPTLYITQRPQESPGSREMTMKMTLTRPDLRLESSTSSPVESKLKDTDMPAGDGGRTHDIEPDDQGTVKKMWRKVWKPRG